MRIIYMGTPEFAVPSLEILIQNDFNVVAVITAPDKPSGRGLQLNESSVKKIAVQHNIPVLQPTNLKEPAFLEELKSYEADLQIVVAFRMLPEVVWNMPRLGTFNLHASLLPQYRGAAPINWAIINGEKETGATTFLLQHEIDTGNILFQEKIGISETENVGELYEKLMMLGSNLVLKTVKCMQTGDYHLAPQQTDGKELKHAPKIFKETCKIDWDLPSINVYNFIRGLSPYPAAFFEYHGRIYKVFEAEVANDKLDEVMATDHKTFWKMRTKDGAIAIKELQPEGKKRMTIEDFLRGNKI